MLSWRAVGANTFLMATLAAPLALREFTFTGKMPRDKYVADWPCIRSTTLPSAVRRVMLWLSSNAREYLLCSALQSSSLRQYTGLIPRKHVIICLLLVEAVLSNKGTEPH
jgi:hypothetical protein